METLAFIHAAVAHEDPTPDSEVIAFETIDLKASGSLAMSLVAAGVVATTLSHTDQAQATIYPGQRGAGVVALQSALGVSRDGIFGSETLAALKRVQADKRLVVDGIAGPVTLPELGLLAGLRANGSSGGSQPNVSGQFGSTYVTARSGLIVRDSPAGYAIGSRGYGARVRVVDNQYAGGRSWSQLTGGGWVASSYLSKYSDGGSSVPIGSGTYAAAGSGLLIRSGPAGYVIGSLGYGAPVSLDVDAGQRYVAGRNWSRLNGGGWVASEYIGYR